LSSTAPPSSFVSLSTDRGVATVVLDNPGRRNALSVSMLEELRTVLSMVAADSELRAVVVTGAGSDFCVGGDLSLERSARVVRRDSYDGDWGRVNLASDCSRLLHEMPKPTIAAVEGGCAGAGMAIALSADLRIVTRRAVFNTAFLNAGLSGDSALVWFLTRIVGSARARELCLLPERVEASAAAVLGLVSRLVDPGDLETVTTEVAARLSSAAPVALRGIKANLNAATWSPLDGYLVGETERMIQTSMTRDSDEAAAAYVEKRPPTFQGQ
jgi:2-(1,2-epoxy-1,2-dihydrophenyl)acetyl-CoA isomerase